jgi:6-phosphogluconolactonase
MFKCNYRTPCTVIAVLAMASMSIAADPLLFVSSFAPGEKGAIHSFRFDLKTGTLAKVHTHGNTPNPFFLALSPDKKFLYSIHAKQFGSKDDEDIAAFAVGPKGSLQFINKQSARGSAACFLQVDATGKSILVANYASGSVATLPIRKDGGLEPSASFMKHEGSSVIAGRQKQPHAHCFVPSPDNRFLYAADLGMDKILIYRLDANTSKATPNDPPFAVCPPGSGPRHFVFHPDGKRAYVVNELANSVTMFDFEPGTGALSARKTITTLPADFKGTSNCADIKITPNGLFLYATNRGHDSIAMYRLGKNDAFELTGIIPSRGKGPQNISIMPGGQWLVCANMPGDNLSVFAIEPETGKLRPSGNIIEMPKPSCIVQGE